MAKRCRNCNQRMSDRRRKCPECKGRCFRPETAHEVRDYERSLDQLAATLRRLNREADEILSGAA